MGCAQSVSHTIRSHAASTARGMGTASRLSLIAALREYAETRGLCMASDSSCQEQCFAHQRSALMHMTGDVRCTPHSCTTERCAAWR